MHSKHTDRPRTTRGSQEKCAFEHYIQGAASWLIVAPVCTCHLADYTRHGDGAEARVELLPNGERG